MTRRKKGSKRGRRMPRNKGEVEYSRVKVTERGRGVITVERGGGKVDE